MIGRRPPPTREQREQKEREDRVRELVRQRAPLDDVDAALVRTCVRRLVADRSVVGDLQWLLEQRAEDFANGDDVAVLAATAAGNEPALKLLLAHGFSPSPHRTDVGQYPVHVAAASWRAAECLPTLLAAGARADVVGDLGTPLEIAMVNCVPAAAALLVERGCVNPFRATCEGVVPATRAHGPVMIRYMEQVLPGRRQRCRVVCMVLYALLRQRAYRDAALLVVQRHVWPLRYQRVWSASDPDSVAVNAERRAVNTLP